MDFYKNCWEYYLHFPKHTCQFIAKSIENFLAGLESQKIHNNSARNEHFLKLGTVVGMGLRFSKTWFTKLHLPPGGRTAQSKMAAVRLYGSSTIDDKIIWSWHETCQKICILGQGIWIWWFEKRNINGFRSKSNMAAKMSENCIHILTILKEV